MKGGNRDIREKAQRMKLGLDQLRTGMKNHGRQGKWDWYQKPRLDGVWDRMNGVWEKGSLVRGKGENMQKA